MPNDSPAGRHAGATARSLSMLMITAISAVVFSDDHLLRSRSVAVMQRERYHHLCDPSCRHFCRSASAARTAASSTP